MPLLWSTEYTINIIYRAEYHCCNKVTPRYRLLCTSLKGGGGMRVRVGAVGEWGPGLGVWWPGSRVRVRCHFTVITPLPLTSIHSNVLL